jgi:8-oxo-dGTP pyrophosphatase MutT (NUDIX family)
VLVPLFRDPQGEELHAVLTKRRSDLRRHAGEISFPGGRRDPCDADLGETALREAEEEIGLGRSDVRLLGELPAVSTFVTGYEIHPFIGAIPAGLRWELSPREVDAVFELSLSALGAARRTARIERRGLAFDTDAYEISGQVIWGATARILDSLLERAEQLTLPRLARG